MAKRTAGYWGRYYQEHREQRRAESRDYQREHGDDRAAYSKRYYAANKHRWKRSPEQQEKINGQRRGRYAKDPAYRAECIRLAKLARANNPFTRANRELRRYGAEGDYATILKRQRGKCAICRRGDQSTRLRVDHCHRTGKFRGLLCNACNLGLGKFGDDPKTLERAAVYLRASIRGKAADK